MKKDSIMCTHYVRRSLLSFFVLFSFTAFSQESRIELHTLTSVILGGPRSFNILLPEGYNGETARYPAVYLFRGHENEWADPQEDDSRRGNIKTVVDALYARQEIGRMILVMPGLGAPPASAEFPYVLDELIPYVDAHFRTIPVRQQRGMDGFSYGGYDMLELLWRRPGAFFTAGAYDGSYWANDLNLFATAPESYWSVVRPMKFLLHTVGSGGNSSSNVQFLNILTAHGIQNGFPQLPLSSGAVHNWYNADIHMSQSLPLHWDHFKSAATNVPLSIRSPLSGSRVSGTVPVTWSFNGRKDTLATLVEISADGGNKWLEIYNSHTPDTTFLWNTTLTPDGARYLLRIRAVGDTLYGFAQMAGRFSVNNPGNASPEIELYAPVAGVQWSGTAQILWWAGDAEGDSLVVSLETSPDDGATWRPIGNPANTGEYFWPTPLVANSQRTRIRIRCSDGVSTSERISAPFTVQNWRPMLLDTLVWHVTGASDGRVSIPVVSPANVRAHRYRLTFVDSVPKAKTYSVRDLDLGQLVLDRIPVGPPGEEGPLFDGVRIVLQDVDPPALSRDSTRWVSGSSTLVPEVLLPTLSDDGVPVQGVPWVADYELELFDHIVDTSRARYFWNPVPVHFVVWNRTDGRRVDFLFSDGDNNRTISRFDDLVILEESVGGTVATWELFFQGTDSSRAPMPGDRFLLKILRPFTAADVFEFRTDPLAVSGVVSAGIPEEFVLGQNYPNPFNPATTIRYSLPRRAHVALSVFNTLGQQVAQLINGESAAGIHEVQFSASGLASGVYFYRMQAGEFTQTRKFLILR
jgi:hypothetical protein